LFSGLFHQTYLIKKLSEKSQDGYLFTSQFELPSELTLQFEASSFAFTLPLELAFAFTPEALQLTLESLTLHALYTRYPYKNIYY